MLAARVDHSRAALHLSHFAAVGYGVRADALSSYAWAKIAQRRGYFPRSVKFRIEFAETMIKVADYPDEADRKWRMEAISKRIKNWRVTDRFGLKFYSYWNDQPIFSALGDAYKAFVCISRIPKQKGSLLTAPSGR